jgi:hypothetical protein
VTPGARALLGGLAAFGAASAALLFSCDPVHDDARSALGDEAPGVATGPLHRAGQPCLVCHDGALGDPPAFSVAGTMYQDANDLVPLDGAGVKLVDALGVTFTTTTNSVGNFFVAPSAYTPHYPLHVSVTSGGRTTTMSSHVGREGSCAFCHVDPPSASSPGHAYWNAPEGGVP